MTDTATTSTPPATDHQKNARHVAPGSTKPTPTPIALPPAPVIVAGQLTAQSWPEPRPKKNLKRYLTGRPPCPNVRHMENTTRRNNTMTTNHNYDEARQYSTGIADEIKALETLLTTDDPEAVAGALATLEQNENQDDPLSTYLNETALDISYYRSHKADNYELRTVILRTCGGPRCEITRDSNDGHQVEITTWEAGETYTYRATAPTLAEQLDQLAEIMTSNTGRH